MEIKTIDSFLSYYERTRELTNRVITVVPPEQLEWTYKTSKFTIGDLIRHIAAIERNVFAEIVLGHKPCYAGCGPELADGYPAVVTYTNEMHRQSMKIFAALTDADMMRKVQSLNGSEVTIGNFLRALVVHEIHHRSALIIYLNMLGVATPSLFGFSEAEVKEASRMSSN
jgi:uncharacterized damage-inducible protein DinB